MKIDERDAYEKWLLNGNRFMTDPYSIFKAGMQAAKSSEQPVGCREAFEEWFKQDHQSITESMRSNDGCYENDYESGCYIGYYWEAWQEAWEHKRESGVVKALKHLIFLHTCEQEGMASGMPKPKDWLDAVDAAQESLNQIEGAKP